MKKLIISITLLLIATPLISAEIIPVWHKTTGPGQEYMIHDIEFLRGEDQFIMLAGLDELGTIQIRDTQTGELVSSFPLHSLYQFNQIEITPDSNRCIIATGGSRQRGATLELRTLSDYSIISKDSLILEGEPKDPQGNPFHIRFRDMIVDPVRPFIYVLIEKTNFSQNKYKDKFYLKVYNYETMELIKDLTPDDFNGPDPIENMSTEDAHCFDVSDDGHYLASLNEGKTYLNIWDLNTMELIKKKRLYDEPFDPSKNRCEVNDIEFSSIDNDLIYFSGYLRGVEKPAVFKYYISDNSYKKIELDRDYSNGRLILFDNEVRILSYAGFSLYFLNQQEKKVELMIEPTLDYPFYFEGLYSRKHGLFIGYSGNYIGSLKYDAQTTVETYTKEITISPNPTSSLINVSLECSDPQINYQISDINGLLISEGLAQSYSGSLQIDFSPYPAGVYFLTINCGDSPLTYKVIRE